MRFAQYSKLIKKGAANPREAFRHVMKKETILQKYYRSFLDFRYNHYRKRRNIQPQKPLIEEITAQEEFTLIILDACRFDYFSRAYEEYLQGDLTKVWASGNNTPNYVASTWTDWHELTYISALPWTSDLAWESVTETEPYLCASSHGYRPSQHLSDVRNIWLSRWDATQFTVPPSEMTRAAIEYDQTEDDTQMVVHYLQPHRPYIGDPGISPWSESINPENIDEAPEDVDLDEVFENRSEVTLEDIYRYDLGWEEFAKYELEFPRLDIQKSIENGDLGLSKYRDAYMANLRLVLESVAELVAHLDCPVYVTADHGEFLGEGKRFLHSNFTHPILREVPWLEVSGSLATKRDVSSSVAVEEDSPDEVADHSVEERLRQLGYLREE